MLRRKIYNDLVAWKQRSGGTTALLIDGARRVGKSFIAKEFAEDEYRSHIIIDFGNVPKDVLDIFENDSTDLDMFFAKLSVFFGTQLYNRESLIVFDEVQQFPRARQLSSTLWQMGATIIWKPVLSSGSRRTSRTLSSPRRRSIWRCSPWTLRNFYGRWVTRSPSHLSGRHSRRENPWVRRFIERS